MIQRSERVNLGRGPWPCSRTARTRRSLWPGVRPPAFQAVDQAVPRLFILEAIRPPPTRRLIGSPRLEAPLSDIDCTRADIRPVLPQPRGRPPVLVAPVIGTIDFSQSRVRSLVAAQLTLCDRWRGWDRPGRRDLSLLTPAAPQFMCAGRGSSVSEKFQPSRRISSRRARRRALSRPRFL